MVNCDESQRPKQIAFKFGPCDLIERREGFIHEEKARLGHERPRNRCPHAHASGKLARIRAREIPKADAAQHLHDAIRDRAAAVPPDAKRQAHIVENRRPGHQGRLLEDVPQVQTAPMLARAIECRPINAARARRVQVRRDAQHGAFSATAWSKDSKELRFARKRKRDAVKGQKPIRKRLAHPLHREKGWLDRLRGGPVQHYFFTKSSV